MVNHSDLIQLLPKGVNCHFFDSIDSTNDFLLNIANSTNIDVCITNEQTKGRGQKGRKWYGYKGGSILLSIKRSFPLSCNLNGLSLVVGIAIIDLLEQKYKIKNLKLKWPNDIYYTDKKLAGILIENQVYKSNQYTVIGLGLNCNIAYDFNKDIKWIDLTQILKKTPNITELAAEIIKSILNYCQIFENLGFKTFQPKWQRVDYLFNKHITIKNQSGVVRGITNDGGLKLQIKDDVKIFYSKE